VRIGPYRLFAKAKGVSGAFVYEIEIETKQSFYDKSGRSVTLAKADSVKEEVAAIRIRPLEPADYFSPSPD